MGSYSEAANAVVSEFYKPEVPSEEVVLGFLETATVSPFDEEKINQYRAVKNEMENRISARDQAPQE